MILSVLGSTGSVGRQTLEVAEALGYEVAGLAAGKNVDLLLTQIVAVKPRIVSVFDEATADLLKTKLRGLPFEEPEIVYGQAGNKRVATHPAAERVVAAISGFVGLPPVMAAIEAGKDVALANKETLVAAGPLVMAKVKEKGVRLLPVDSEHAAIFQCLGGKPLGERDRIWLTCSGGPFFGRSRDSLRAVQAADALKHPTWAMGAKITIDSATLMNKALEVVEAVHLFGAEPAQVKVIIHRSSIIHSMVSFADGSTLAQLGMPDMRLAIQQALTYPQVCENKLVTPFDPSDPCCRELSFHDVDRSVFPALDLVDQALAAGGLMPLVMNAANEAAVALFLAGKLSFYGIYEAISRAMAAYRVTEDVDVTNPDAMMDLHHFVMRGVRPH